MLTATEITRLIELRRRLDERPEPQTLEYRRLLFARWLVATGRLGEDC